MIKKYNKLSLNNKLKIAGLLFVLFPILALRASGVLQALELAVYDLSFVLTKPEQPDNRIVLVTWNEEDIQAREENIISDRTLSFVLEKVLEGKPTVIGLDLYRDTPQFLQTLTNEQNRIAYENLQKIFRENDNIFGIEKAINPTVKPPLALKQKQPPQVGSSDVIEDSDRRNRRIFIDPRPEIEGNTKGTYLSIPYIGLILADEYLSKRGWQFKPIDSSGSISFNKGDKKIIVKQLKPFDGAYVFNRVGVDTLINYRRNQNPFTVVPINEILADRIDPKIFEGKIIIIGNTASSTADRHNLAINRWKFRRANETWNYGVYLPAHVASSVVSAALDGRPLLQVIPIAIGTLIIIPLLYLIQRIFFLYRKRRTTQLISIVSFLTIVLIISLEVISLIVFDFGYWLPIMPSILSLLLANIVFFVIILQEQEKANALAIKLAAEDFMHKLGNDLEEETNIIASIKHQFKRLENEIKHLYGEDDNQNLQKIYDLLIKHDKWFSKITEDLSNCNVNLRTIEAFHYNQFSEIINLNEFINSYSLEISGISISKTFDQNFLEVAFIKSDLKKVLNNLIYNAIKAVKAKNFPGYTPQIRITTEKKKGFALIKIQDNGIGIPEDVKSKVFLKGQSYWQKTSTGMGLYITKKLVEAADGKISFASTTEGTEFIVFLPLV